LSFEDLYQRGGATLSGARRWVKEHPRISKWIAVIALAVGAALAVVPVVQASIRDKAAEACAKDIYTCKNPVIQRVLQTSDDRESVARAVLVVYGEAIRTMNESGGSTGQEMARQLPQDYQFIVDQLRQGGAEPRCVREGLAKLLADDGLNTSRTTLLSKYFDAAGNVAGVLPGPREALEQYLSAAAKLPESGAKLVTYKKYQLFPYEGALTCAQ
jgi:hypothetical protein